MNNTDSLMYITNRPEHIFVKGKGSWLWDNQGKKYLDFIQGWAVNCLGHCHPLMIEAINQQANQLLNPSPAFYNQPMIELADKLKKLSGLDKVFFANSGAEANEGAFKLARKWGKINKNGAYEIITLVNGFHGRTLACMSASGKKGWDEIFEPKVPGFIKVPINDINAIKEKITANTVAVMLELIQGEAGVNICHQEYISELKKLAVEKNFLLIFDEVQTGVGRTGKMFAFEHFGIKPDIMTLGKGLGGGVPLTALLSTKEVACFEAGDQGGTFNGNPLMTKVGLAVVDEVSNSKFLHQVNQTSEYIKDQLKKLSPKFNFQSIRGYGLLIAFDIPNYDAFKVASLALDQGLLLNAPREHTIRIVPALNVSLSEVDQMIEILSSVLDSLS